MGRAVRTWALAAVLGFGGLAAPGRGQDPDGPSRRAAEGAAAIYAGAMERAVSILRSGRRAEYDLARTELTRALQAMDGSPEPWYWLGLLEMADGKAPRLVRARARDAAARAGDGFPEAHLLEGQLRLREGDSDYQAAHVSLALALRGLEARREAEGGAAAAGPDPLAALARYNLGRLHYHRTAGARANPEARRADLAEAARLLSGAEPDLARLAAERPAWVPVRAECLMYLGWCAFDGREYAKADPFFAQAMELDPASAEPPFWRGLCARRNGRLAEADRWFARAIASVDEWNRLRPGDRRPPHAEAMLQRASLCWSGDPELHNPWLGVERLREFVREAPTHPLRAAVARYLAKAEAGD